MRAAPRKVPHKEVHAEKGIKRQQRDREQHATLTGHLEDAPAHGDDITDEQQASRAEREAMDALLSSTRKKQVQAKVPNEQWQELRA